MLDFSCREYELQECSLHFKQTEKNDGDSSREDCCYLYLYIYLELNIKLEHLSVSLLPLSYCPPCLPDEHDVFHLCVLILNPPNARSGCPCVSGFICTVGF